LFEGPAGAVELGLDFAGVAKQVAVEVIVGIVLGVLERESEPAVRIFLERFFGVVAVSFEGVQGLFEEEFLEADLDLLGAEDAPSVGGELGGKELLVGVLGSEVLLEAVAKGLKVFGAFEGEDGEFGGEAVLDGVETGFRFSG
jgi:hypothetical protein